jgi:hypothetical protein
MFQLKIDSSQSQLYYMCVTSSKPSPQEVTAKPPIPLPYAQLPPSPPANGPIQVSHHSRIRSLELIQSA